MYVLVDMDWEVYPLIFHDFLVLNVYGIFSYHFTASIGMVVYWLHFPTQCAYTTGFDLLQFVQYFCIYTDKKFLVYNFSSSKISCRVSDMKVMLVSKKQVKNGILIVFPSSSCGHLVMVLKCLAIICPCQRALLNYVRFTCALFWFYLKNIARTGS